MSKRVDLELLSAASMLELRGASEGLFPLDPLGELFRLQTLRLASVVVVAVILSLSALVGEDSRMTGELLASKDRPLMSAPGSVGTAPLNDKYFRAAFTSSRERYSPASCLCSEGLLLLPAPTGAGLVR